MSTINSDEHDAEHGVRSGQEQQARSEPVSEGVRYASQQLTVRKTREEMRAQLAETSMPDRYHTRNTRPSLDAAGVGSDHSG